MPETLLDDIRDQKVLVTGAGSGIGLSIARRFVDHGATVGALILPGDTSGTENLAPLAKRGLTVVEADVADSAQVEAAVGSFIEAKGTVDVLVSNAGIGGKAPFMEISTADWKRMFEVHVGGAIHTTNACLPGMLEQGSGRIMFTASELVDIGLENLAHYCAAKGALTAMMRSLSREVGPAGVTVNCVAPGPTLTPMFKRAKDEFTEENRESIPMRSFGDPDNIAWTWLFLASDGGRWTTGQVVRANGGVSMG